MFSPGKPDEHGLLLIADDDKDTRDMYVALFRLQGNEPDAVATAEQALTLASKATVNYDGPAAARIHGRNPTGREAQERSGDARHPGHCRHRVR